MIRTIRKRLPRIETIQASTASCSMSPTIDHPDE